MNWIPTDQYDAPQQNPNADQPEEPKKEMSFEQIFAHVLGIIIFAFLGYLFFNRMKKTAVQFNLLNQGNENGSLKGPHG